jgi:inhibitor of KinA
MSSRANMCWQDYANLHAQGSYIVYMIGGFPGFPFMGDLPDILHAPRRPSPRLEVPAGSVAVAGRITAIYPSATPGGWNLVGRTPVPIFDVNNKPPTLLAPGDTVKFQQVSQYEFERLKGQFASGAGDTRELRVS